MAFLRKQINRNSSNSSQNQTESTEKPFGTSTPMKPCRYGVNCSRVDCHFAHSDRKSPSVNNTTASSVQPGTSPSSSSINQRSSPWFPLQFTMDIDEDTNELTVDLNGATDGSTENESDFIKNDTSPVIEDAAESVEREQSENTISSTRSSMTPTSLISCISQKKLYKLTAVVCQVNNGPQKNLVALINVGGKYHKMKMGDVDENFNQWYIFNDFR